MVDPVISELVVAVAWAWSDLCRLRDAYDTATAVVRREHSPDAVSHADAAIARVRASAAVLAAAQQALRDACPACRPLRRWTGCPAHELILGYC